jgi:hypothetical protein
MEVGAMKKEKEQQNHIPKFSESKKSEVADFEMWATEVRRQMLASLRKRGAL